MIRQSNPFNSEFFIIDHSLFKLLVRSSGSELLVVFLRFDTFPYYNLASHFGSSDRN